MPLVEGQTNVYAIAVTWPSDLVVSRVTIVYLGGPEHPVYLPPPAFLPDSQVTPLPAVAVASPSAAPTIDSTAIRSGEFLIAPTDASSATAPGIDCGGLAIQSLALALRRLSGQRDLRVRDAAGRARPAADGLRRGTPGGGTAGRSSF